MQWHSYITEQCATDRWGKGTVRGFFLNKVSVVGSYLIRWVIVVYCFFLPIFIFSFYFTLRMNKRVANRTLIHSRLEKSTKTSFILFYQLHCAKSAKCMWVKKQMERSKQTFQHIAISTEDSNVLKRLLACVHLFLTHMHFALFAQCNCQINATFWFLVIWININRISTVTNIDLYLHVQTTIFLGDY